ncbi:MULTISPECIES: carbohydrate ABC transporter permease [unclassified Mesorhizobium]|uniref:carbohydrate ABC transporter permease n=1 Tax=unclassified Mesorhizobium TaxID=325217 RepID=UPI0015E35930|nr:MULTISPECIES: carbohydrate ABC transporter permease [unclassified Mesorhizobium]
MNPLVLASRRPVAVIARALALLFLVSFLFFPVYWMMVTALKPNQQIFVQFPEFIPTHPVLDNFKRAISQSNLPTYLVNSMITAGGSSLLTTTLAALAAYGFAKYRFSGRFATMNIMIGAQMFPFAVILISLYPMMQSAGLLDTLTGLTIAYVVFALPPAIYILFSFYSRLPNELIEAARIDGASEIAILRRIVLPLSKPALISVAVYSFTWAWNDLLYSLTLVTSDNLRTIGPGLLLTFFGEMQQDWGGAMAAAILASLPAVIIFAFLQRFFVAGLTSGAVKS